VRQELAGSERNQVSLTCRGCLQVENLDVWRPAHPWPCHSPVLLPCSGAVRADPRGIATVRGIHDCRISPSCYLCRGFMEANLRANCLVVLSSRSPSSKEGSISLPSCHSFQLVTRIQSGSAAMACSHMTR